MRHRTDLQTGANMADSAALWAKVSRSYLGHTGGLDAGAQVLSGESEGDRGSAVSEECNVVGMARDAATISTPFVLKGPMEVMSGMLECGLSTADAMKLVMEYYRVAEVVHGNVAGSSEASYDTGGHTSVSSATTGSTGRSRRTDNWRRAARALAERPGYCYLRVIRFSRRKRISLLLGPNPDVSKFVAALRSDDVDLSAMSTMWVFSVPGLDDSSRYWYHIAEKCEQGEKIAVARDFFSAYSKKYPYLCDGGFSVDGAAVSFTSLPLVGKIGFFSTLFSTASARVAEDVDCESSLENLRAPLVAYTDQGDEFPGNWLVVDVTGHGRSTHGVPILPNRRQHLSGYAHIVEGAHVAMPVVPSGCVYALVLRKGIAVAVDRIVYGSSDTVVVLLLSSGVTSLEFQTPHHMWCVPVDVTGSNLVITTRARGARRPRCARVVSFPASAVTSSEAYAEQLCSREPGPGEHTAYGQFQTAASYVVRRTGSVWYSDVRVDGAILYMVVGGVVRIPSYSGDVHCPAHAAFSFELSSHVRERGLSAWSFVYEHSRCL